MAAMVAVGPSPLGGEGVFAQRDFAPGEQAGAARKWLGWVDLG